ncbi:MAG: YajQ family cyclic di-GMP-binding protein [Elusimicrobia bacterium]|nr:YajQ family cyclic di-GMP-binding protein [Elusimicrobiota bacterium]
MASEFSFDVVSKVDLQAVEDSVHIANKEISTRFDFKGSISRIELDKKAGELTLFAEDEMKLKSVLDILQTRLAKRGVPLKNLSFQKIEPAEKSTVRQKVLLQQGIPTDKAKEIVKEIKSSGIKAQAAIQGDQIRVSSKSKDILQAAITSLKSKDFHLDLQFTNYR